MHGQQLILEHDDVERRIRKRLVLIFFFCCFRRTVIGKSKQSLPCTAWK